MEKQWCKYDIEFALFRQRKDMDRTLYWDAYWYPDGIPVLFTSMHNTKRFEEIDWLLYMLAICDKRRPRVTSCPVGRHAPAYCKEGSVEERRLRNSPRAYAEHLCCCYDPRQETPIYWANRWYRSGADVPMQPEGVRKPRLCLLP